MATTETSVPTEALLSHLIHEAMECGFENKLGIDDGFSYDRLREVIPDAHETDTWGVSADGDEILASATSVVTESKKITSARHHPARLAHPAEYTHQERKILITIRTKWTDDDYGVDAVIDWY